MTPIDFKNLTVDQEKAISRLIEIAANPLVSDLGNSANANILIYIGDKKFSSVQLKEEIENLTVFGIKHVCLYLSTTQKILKIKRDKKKKSLFSRLKFW